MSEESTAWYWPSLRTTRTPMTGKPMSWPFFMTARKPLSQEGMNSRGMRPPLTSFDELVGALGQGLEPADDPAVLAGAAGLLLVGVVEFDAPG